MSWGFERTRRIVEEGIHQGLHPGIQIYVSREGQVLIDEAFGAARENVPLRTDSLTLWFSAGKPITALAVGQLVERGQLDWEMAVTEVIPEFSGEGREQVTLRHLLTHTAGLRGADRIDDTSGWDEKIARICKTPLEPGWVPGERAGYHVSGTWYLLGEIVRRTSGEPLDEFVRKNIFLPLHLFDSWLSLGPDEVSQYGDRMAFAYDTTEGQQRSLEEWNSAEGLQRCRPGGSARGPVRELGRLYEALLQGGAGILQRATVETMTARQRQGLRDETFAYVMDWGFGFILNSNRDGFQMPYSYGRWASPDTFGHSGNQSSCAFADPTHQLVVAWCCNGLPGERDHQRRQRAINNSIYEELGMGG